MKSRKKRRRSVIRFALAAVLCVGLTFSANAFSVEMAIITNGVQNPASENTVAVPIIMYHGFLKDPASQTQFVIAPALLESDLIYLQAHGYTSVLMKDLIAYVNEAVPLPEKPIILSFDDGYYNNYLYAYPLLRQYEMKGVFSIIGSATEAFSANSTDANHANYSHMTWDQLREVQASGVAEVQNHSYDLHTYDNGRKGVQQKARESSAAYRGVLEDDVAYLQQRIGEELGVTPNTFAYPFGFFNADSSAYMRELGFSATLSCTEGINYFPAPGHSVSEKAAGSPLTSVSEGAGPSPVPDSEAAGDPGAASLYDLKRILRPPDLTAESFFEKWGIT